MSTHHLPHPHWTEWAKWPWHRCRSRLVRGTEGAGEHFGRCDLRRDHVGLHGLERGFDVVFFDNAGQVLTR